MDIRATTDFEVVEVVRSETSPPKLTLEHSSLAGRLVLVGAVLEAQFRVLDGDYLLFVTEGTPYEEALHLYLVDSRLQVRDSVELSANYTPGMLQDLRIVPPDGIGFTFFGRDEEWIVEILDRPRLKVFGSRFPVKRAAPVLCRTWLELRRRRERQR